MARRGRFTGKVRPLGVRIEEMKDKLDKLTLQEKIAELRAKVKSKKRRR